MATKTNLVAFASMLLLSSVAHAELRVHEAPLVRVQKDASKRTLVVDYGPVDLPARLTYGGTLVPVSAAAELQLDGWLRSFEVTVLDAHGRRIVQPVLHHAGLFAPDQRDLFNDAMRRIVAFGSETSPIRLPGDLGYRVQPGDSILLLAALYNVTSEPIVGVHLRINIVYADARLDFAYRDALPLYLDVLPPGDRVYDIAPGVSARSYDWTPAVSGKILALGGHLHQYGVSVALEDVTSGDTIWTGHALYDASGALKDVERKIFWRGLRMHANHTYRITAIYNNPTGTTIPGAMGKIGGLFVPDENGSHPQVNRASDDYKRDYHAMIHHTHEADHVQASEQK